MLDQVELQYDEFRTWHARALQTFLEPARQTSVRVVNELLDQKIAAIDRARFRITTSRVKGAARAFTKIGHDKYRTRVQELDDVPNVIDDPVRIRLVCNNLSDINTLQEVLGELEGESSAPSGIGVEQSSHRDYFREPKPSGYRAYHVNLVVPVLHFGMTRRVRVEVQARTLLQNGWGELTHEDTYKPGSTVPDWIVGMSLRMAELLAAVDNIAQDLRTALDIETSRAVESSGTGQPLPEIALVPER